MNYVAKIVRKFVICPEQIWEGTIFEGSRKFKTRII